MCVWGGGLSWRKHPAPGFQKAQTTAELTGGASLGATIWPPRRVVRGFSAGMAGVITASPGDGVNVRVLQDREGETPSVYPPTLNQGLLPSSQCAGGPQASHLASLCDCLLHL